MSRARDLRQYQNSSPSPPSSTSRGNNNQIDLKQSSRSNNSQLRSESPTDFPQERYRNYGQERSIRPPQPVPNAPPMRPQRSAARQSATINNNSAEPYSSTNTNNLSQRSYRSPQLEPYQEYQSQGPIGQPASPSTSALEFTDRRGINNRLFEAISGKASPSREPIRRAPPPQTAQNQERNHERGGDRAYRQAQRPGNDLLDPEPRRMRRSSKSSSSAGSHDPDSDLLSPEDLKQAKQVHGARNVLDAFQSNQQRSTPRKQPSGGAPTGGANRRPTQDSYESQPSFQNDQSYPKTPGFKEIERVLEKIKIAWERTGITQTGIQDGYVDDDLNIRPFSAVGLALDLLESESNERSQVAAKKAKAMINQKGGMVPTLSSFLRIKAELQRALQLTIQGNYRQFDASVSSYNLTKTHVENSHRKVLELRTKLLECKKTFGDANQPTRINAPAGKSSEMRVFQARRELLGEMLKLIDTIDQLKQVPERLESLIASKRFLSATVLLVRSLRSINKPEMLEIGGLVDLRAYLINQENVLFDILIEELHNHLYLKSYSCESRWKPYEKGQKELPVIQRADLQSSDSLSKLLTLSYTKNSLEQTPSLQNYLKDLHTKPQSNPLLDEPEIFFPISTSNLFQPNENDEYDNQQQQNVPMTTATSNSKKRKNQNFNPELNSFFYTENLIESLAVIGKLTLGLDMVLRRVSVEIFQLIEITLTEVDERHEMTKRSIVPATSAKNNMKSNMNMMVLLISSSTDNLNSLINQKSRRDPSYGTLEVQRMNSKLAGFRTNLNELKELDLVFEILRDLFWTLYSKLDATLQSFRVLHEVSLRIVERKGFKEDGVKSSQALFSLLEVWKPIQTEVRSLMSDYLADLSKDHLGPSSNDSLRGNLKGKSESKRNPMASIAEVLKINLSGSSSTNNLINASLKDPNKVFFKFKNNDGRTSNKNVKVHELNLDSALKVSVPGLILDPGTITSNTLLITSGLTTKDDNTKGTKMTVGLNDGNLNAVGGTGVGKHRSIVKPSVFFIGILLQPTIKFLNRVKEVLPSGDVSRRINVLKYGGLCNFFEELVLNRFVPQLEERVFNMFDFFCNGPELFQYETLDDRGNLNSNDGDDLDGKRLVKSSGGGVDKFFSLSFLIKMIDSLINFKQVTIFNQDRYGTLIILLIEKYYFKCSDRFKELISRENGNNEENGKTNCDNMKLAAFLAQDQSLIQVLKKLCHPNVRTQKKLLQKEYKVEQDLLKRLDRPIILQDLIQSSRKLNDLTELYCTLELLLCFLHRLASIVTPVKEREETTEDLTVVIEGVGKSLDKKKDKSEKTEGFIKKYKAFRFPTHLRLPLTFGVLKKFQLVIESIENLSQRIIYILRLDLRISSYYYIDLSFKEGDYYLSPSDSVEPDSNIIELSSIISNSESLISKLFRTMREDYMIFGLSNLLNRLMIESVLKLKVGNEIGFQKMTRNLIALKQSMKTIFMEQDDYLDNDDEAIEVDENFKSFRVEKDFESCKKFWEAASHGTKAVMDLVRKYGGQYSFEHYRRLLCFLCKIDPIGSSVPSNSSENNKENSIDAIEVYRLSIVSASSNLHNGERGDGKRMSLVPFERRRRIYNECLIELHALVFDEDEEQEEEDNK
ncbi:hypothetical protein BY996DRAFT_4582113 [Phakopsora pachyrhizi]|nr:hypothetical protein BY996DRAFT_4582113 [Phakopsora pachyrhizi]